MCVCDDARLWLGWWYGQCANYRCKPWGMGEFAKMAAAYFEICDMLNTWAATHDR